jgi:hypothetical protein
MIQIFLMRQFHPIFAHKTKQIYSIQFPSRLLPEMIRIMIIIKIPKKATSGKHLALGALAVPLRLCLTTAAVFSLLGKVFAIAVVDPHEGFTPLVVSPAKWRLDRSSRHPCPLQQVQGRSHDRTLHLNVPWLSARIAQWKVSEDEPSNAAFLDDITRRTHYYSGYTIFLQVPGNQTHGLVADRSEGGKKNGIDLVLLAPF